MMSEAKRGPLGRTIDIDGPESVRSWLGRYWRASAGIRLIVAAGLLAVLAVVLMASVR